ncbi:MAG: hypothetical protein U0L49_06090 [Eubacterium sp.]|nr:hypothetical protein [Eubacterium sp.]
MIYDRLKEEQNYLASKMDYLQSELSAMPAGKLIAVKNGNYTKWFQSNGSKPIYIEKKQRPYAKELAYKKFLNAELAASLQEKEAIDKCISNFDKINNKALGMLDDSSPYRELLDGRVVPQLDHLKDWAEADYDRDPTNPEELIYRTSAGLKVRSISELLIANALFFHKIPYRVECALPLGPSIFYPTFTIRHPYTGKTFYWEHCDFMDNPKYCQAVYSRLGIYSLHGILPGVNLILTFETDGASIEHAAIQRIITHYFFDDFSWKKDKK